MKTLILTGPTAVGKTDVSLEIVETLRSKHQIDVEIINADSMLVYRGMDIGTAKPSIAERQGIAHHLIDICNPDQSYSAGEFYRDVKKTLSLLHEKQKRALIVGGTGFYLKALIYGIWDAPKSTPELRQLLESMTTRDLHSEVKTLDPEALTAISEKDRYRLIRVIEVAKGGGPLFSALQKTKKNADPDFTLFWLERSQETLETRIRARTKTMLAQGWIDEVKALRLAYGNAKALDAVGYREIKNFLDGIQPPSRKIREGLLGLEDEIVLATRQLVKRQRTWVKGQFDHVHTFDAGKKLDDLRARAVSFYYETNHHPL